MSTTNPSLFQSLKRVWLLVIVVFISQFGFSQEIPAAQDSTKTGHVLGSIKMPNPKSIVSKYTYDPITDRYIFTQTVGSFNINYPLILTPTEYQKLVLEENLKNYYKQKVDIAEGKKDGTEGQQKNLLPEFYVNSGFFESIFGGNTIEVVPQGSVEMDLGILFTKQDNPSFSPRNRSNFTFDFDQRISLSLLGKVGTRLQVTANYDTESTFDFQNLIKLEYTPTEDDIVRKIEVGNVSMPLNSSLITGAQSLFGVKTELQFGKTRVTAVFSEQKSQSRSVVAQGGGTLEEFSFYARDYDENRHFFLAQYFRDRYDVALQRYPYINSNVQITRIEVWVTNRSNQTDNVRNVAAFQDLGESQRVGSDVSILRPGPLPDNKNNGFDPTNIGGAGSNLNTAVRDITRVEQGINIPANEGFDFGKLENARKLIEGYDYTLQTQLGYISLNQRLLNDEVLAVAYQYTVGDKVYQVGEFANDGVEATDSATDPNTGNIVINNNNLILKMLKSAITNVNQPIWDLMMKNIYDSGAYQLSQEDFKLNIFYTEASPLNYIKPVEGTAFPPYDNNTPDPSDDTPIMETPLIRLFHLDRLNYNNDPQQNGDGFFDFVPGITVLTQNGKIIFTKVEPFGKYLFDVLADPAYPSDYNDPTYTNPNQEKYVYDLLYKGTKTAALEEADKNKFQLKGRYKSTGSDGIAIGAFNVPRGSVKVTAGGRVLVEGVDYTVNYQLGRVEILDQALKASNTPINVSVENNAVFGQQTKRFTGINVEHQFNENFVLGATFLNLSERPITQKANYNSESINNTILGLNGNYSTDVPFLTRLANKLPNIDTDVPSNLSVRGEFAYLMPGAPKGTDFQGESTAYVDDFEGSQGSIDLLAPQAWFLSSRPKKLGIGVNEDDIGIQNGYNRAMLNWYSVDPIFYSSQRPNGITENDLSDLYARRVFIDEIFPQRDLVQGQSTVIQTLDLAYYPNERGPYNFQTQNINLPNTLTSPRDSWAGITRQITSTDFEQANVEYIEFWVQDPFLDNPTNPGGKLLLNLGNISEDILKDGKKQYENGLPDTGDVSGLNTTEFGSVVPRNQSLIYAFSSLGTERENQDVGYDGYNDAKEIAEFGSQFGDDPSNDNYQYFLQAEGNIFDRYKKYNGTEGNSPDVFSDTNRGSTTQPDVEDINRDNTMNTIDSYYEYEVDISRASLDNPNNALINDVKTRNITLPNGENRDVRWYQFRIPIDEATRAIGGITDIRSIRFARMYLKEFSQPTVMRFASLDLVRSDWRRYGLDLDADPTNNSSDASFSVGVIGLQENEGNYVLPPGVELEQLNNNNNIQRQNEQSLVVEVCELEGGDSRGVYKNISIDMRQYKKLKMFMHAEATEGRTLNPGEMVGFIRMGNDFTQNFYEIQVPLNVVSGAGRDQVWPSENEIDITLDVLQQIKSMGISDGTLSNQIPTLYNVTSAGPVLVSGADSFEVGETRVAIKGNPNFGDVRVLMVGVKNNTTATNLCGKVWFNELRLSDLDNEGGWAAVLSMDSNIADFADISATGRQSTVGFGGIEQRPNERSREDVQQYDVVTNMNLGQLLPKKWGIQVPFNYGQSEEMITPKYDQYYNDLTLDSRREAARSSEEEDEILEQSQDYTKRKSINFIGVRKQRTGDEKPRFYDVENLTFNYSYNKVEHRDFEIENALDQNLRTGVNYAYSFEPITYEPFAKNDSLFTNKYLKILKDINFNLLPNSFTVNSDILRQFNKQKFREVELAGNNIGLEELFRRNYRFDFQYALNYQLSKSLNLNFSANNTNIVRNYFVDDVINGRQDPTLTVWDGFFDFGDPNIQNQQLQLNYEIPLYKIPTFSFLKATYSYTGDFQWQKGSDLNTNLPIIDETTGVTTNYNLGNSIQNANTHNINSTLNMETLYKYVGLVRKGNANAAAQNRRPTPDGLERRTNPNNPNAEQQKNPDSNAGTKAFNTFVDVVTMVKRVQVNYSENNGSFLPGYLRTPGFIGTMKPTFGYTFGSQSDIRDLVARNGWLTVYPDFNQQYSEVTNRILDVSANIEVIKDLKIDLIGSRMYSENTNENFNTLDFDNDGISDAYNTLITNSFGNFNISTALIKTAFSPSDEQQSAAFNDFRSNRLVIAQRLAQDFYGNNAYPTDAEGYPVGFGKNNQAVLLPAFLSAYQGSNPDNVKLKAFRDIPIPNWTLKYTGLMRLKWFKDKFKRFSVSHGYRSGYTINQFRTNLDYDQDTPEALDQGGNFKNQTLFSNINLEEMFSPLVKLDFEMQNSVKILAEVKKDRILSLSFDNNLLTEIKGNEYTLGLGYRIKDVRIRSKMAGPTQIIKADLNMKADVSLRDNKTIIRYLDLDDNQVTSGQTIWGVKYSADYAFSKNLTGIFYFDYTFSEYAISTAFPQTTIRSGITLRYNFGN
ncbi:cell surface protein SprA [Gelidibacter salicanalis]|uniref:Cell surface protein SprA n=1 Tax=Gelidibacter salicanalis TaxID=291193 RepID=A0A5C7AE97_9FLAO|nr:cell surface protein SprA [Gelidibacter salicanalis]TXE06741.1 cell surface protein SprA [Gelidibacter salicanalis]